MAIVSAAPATQDRPEEIDRDRLDAALDRIGHKGSAVFRARIADAYDALVDGRVS